MMARSEERRAGMAFRGEKTRGGDRRSRSGDRDGIHYRVPKMMRPSDLLWRPRGVRVVEKGSFRRGALFGIDSYENFVNGDKRYG